MKFSVDLLVLAHYNATHEPTEITYCLPKRKKKRKRGKVEKLPVGIICHKSEYSFISDVGWHHIIFFSGSFNWQQSLPTVMPLTLTLLEGSPLAHNTQFNLQSVTPKQTISRWECCTNCLCDCLSDKYSWRQRRKITFSQDKWSEIRSTIAFVFYL